MPKIISCAMSPDQILDQSKTVSRRQAWLDLKAGDLLQPVRKAMGLKKGQKVEKLGGLILVTKVNREPINLIKHGDCVREGFPELSPQGFIQMYCKANGCKPSGMCTRIEFEYCDESQAAKNLREAAELKALQANTFTQNLNS